MICMEVDTIELEFPVEQRTLDTNEVILSHLPIRPILVFSIR